jgi:PmbA protein
MVSILGYTQNDLNDLALKTIDLAKSNGASDVEVDLSVSSGKTISVRLSQFESIEANNDKNLSITFYQGQKRAIVSTSDFSLEAIKNCIESAKQIANYTQEDEAFGLADRNLMATETFNLDLHHPFDFDDQYVTNYALECESAALDSSPLITNSEGSQFYQSQSIFCYANSKKNSEMQRDSSYSSKRCFDDLKSHIEIGKDAGLRAIQRLGPRKIKTGHYPVIFEAPVAMQLISTLVSAISGGNLYRQNSFLLDSVGKQIASSHLSIYEDPFLRRGNASTYFDDDGVKVTPRYVINQGQLEGYFLSSYTGKKLGLPSTGNAGGVHNLIVSNSNIGFNDLIKTMHQGLVVTEILGHGTNMVTGDYSRGVAGFWVDHGEIQHAVEEITIAGNLKDMLMGIKMIANDCDGNSSKYVGSILINEMTIGAT